MKRPRGRDDEPRDRSVARAPWRTSDRGRSRTRRHRPRRRDARTSCRVPRSLVRQGCQLQPILVAMLTRRRVDDGGTAPCEGMHVHPPWSGAVDAEGGDASGGSRVSQAGPAAETNHRADPRASMRTPSSTDTLGGLERGQQNSTAMPPETASSCATQAASLGPQRTRRRDPRRPFGWPPTRQHADAHHDEARQQ